MKAGVSVCREATNENLEGGIWVAGSGESFRIIRRKFR